MTTTTENGKTYRRKVEIGPATLYLGDSLAIMGGLSGLDAVVTDPPYSSGGAFRGDRSRPTTEKYLSGEHANAKMLEDFTGDTRDQRGFHFWSALWSGAARVASKEGAVFAFFTDWRQLPITTDYAQAGGWTWRGLVPWAKPAYRPQLGRFGAACEYLVWGSNGVLPLEREVACLPGFFNSASPRLREHVTEKPLDVMVEIVAIVDKGGTILDPFMGSGTTGVAAVKTGRKFVGIEIHERYFEIAARRIAAAVGGGEQGGLFDAMIEREFGALRPEIADAAEEIAEEIGPRAAKKAAKAAEVCDLFGGES